MTSNASRLSPPIFTSWSTFRDNLFRPVDPAFLAYFRVAFGVVMVWETWRIIENDWVGTYFSGREFYFTYWPFDFVRPWPGDGMYIHLALMGLFATFIVLGLFYRFSVAAFFLMITHLFLLEQARYLNHLYLVCLLSFIMIFLPAHRCFSLDTLLRPKISSPSVPKWSLWLLRFQVAVPMFFGGVAKLNSDWLRGEPLRAWLAVRTDFPLLGPSFTNEAVVWGMIYGALIVDLFFVLYMLNRRTRVFGFMLVLLFHFMNARLFGIGIFPWLMIASTLVFFGPDWPRKVLHDIRRHHSYRLPALIAGFTTGYAVGSLLPGSFDLMRALIGGIGVAIAAYHLDEPFQREEGAAEPGNSAGELKARLDFSVLQKGTLAMLGLWVAFQVIVPLRHFAIPGKVHWTEEGHNFSWHMKLRDKSSEGFFLITDTSTGEEWVLDPRVRLSSIQTSKMASRPEMILQFAHYLEEKARESGYQDVEVRANIVSSLNGRPPQRLVDPTVDLTQVRRPWIGHAQWILPLEVPLHVRN
jgi:vitamin K-dependent gamma-carboxylase